MKKMPKTAIVVLGLALIAATPMQSYAASFRLAPIADENVSVVEKVHGIRRRHRHRSRRNRNIAAGVIGGLIIGGIIANSTRRSADRDHDHVDWCYDRYRSYRASDNTYQPYHGGRRQCNSPYY